MGHTPEEQPGIAVPPDSPRLQWMPAGELPDLAELLAASVAEGLRYVLRLCDDWATGTNRFGEPGEGLLVAFAGDRVVAVCALNRDPFLTDAGVGRVRRFYVLPGFRGRGLGGRMLDTVVARACLHFHRVKVRSLEAGAFYLAHGFHRLEHDPDATHERILAVE